LRERRQFSSGRLAATLTALLEHAHHQSPVRRHHAADLHRHRLRRHRPGSGPTFTLATVESEVSQAVGWYGKNIGFMFDEGATTCALESSYYLPLYNYVKSVTSNGPVEINPGTVNSSMSCYMRAADILHVYVLDPNCGSNCAYLLSPYWTNHDGSLQALYGPPLGTQASVSSFTAGTRQAWDTRGS
jgi:hypothetical protein